MISCHYACDILDLKQRYIYDFLDPTDFPLEIGPKKDLMILHPVCEDSTHEGKLKISKSRSSNRV